MAAHSHDDLQNPMPRNVRKSAVDAVLGGLIRSGSGFVSLLSGLLAAVLILYSGYVIYDSFNTQYSAFTSAWDLLQYKPEIIEDNQTPLAGFNTLASINQDYRAWLSVYDTTIDYPVVQGENDLYYASHDIYRNSSLTGAIYLAAGNKYDFSDSYNLIYGHHMDNGAMFGALDSFRSQAYFDAHREAVVVAENGNVYDVTFFAVVSTDAYESRIYTVGDRMDDVLAFLESGGEGGVGIGTRTLIYDEAPLAGAAKLLALSTCASAETSGRLVVFGVMRKVHTFSIVEMEWDDDNDRDGLRPDTLTIRLWADGKPTGVKVVLSEENGWREWVEDLDAVDANGNPISYFWLPDEAAPEEYGSITDETLSNVTKHSEENEYGIVFKMEQAMPGTHTFLSAPYRPLRTTRTVAKVWADDDDRDGVRPAQLTVTLMANGEILTTRTLNAANNWTATVNDLYVNENGAPITYAWTEPAIVDYGQTGNATAGTTTTLTNAHEIEKLDLTVRKSWDDNEDEAGKRPASVTLYLLSVDEEGAEKTVAQAVLTKENGWEASVSVPRNEKGKAARYVWREAAVAGYATAMETEGDITTVTNTLEQRRIDPPGPHKLTIQYRVLRTGAPIASTVEDIVVEGDEYSVPSPEIDGYRIVRGMTVVEGTMGNRDEVYTVFYLPVGDDTIFIDDFETPLGLGEVIINVGDCFE